MSLMHKQPRISCEWREQTRAAKNRAYSDISLLWLQVAGAAKAAPGEAAHRLGGRLAAGGRPQGYRQSAQGAVLKMHECLQCARHSTLRLLLVWNPVLG